MRLSPSLAGACALLLAVPPGAPAEGPGPAPIAILGAMEAETAPVLAVVAGATPTPLRGIPCVSATVDGRRVVVAATGVGKVNAALTTTLLVERFAPAAVVFTGVAGALDPDLQPGDVVVAETLVHHDLLRYTEAGARPRIIKSPSTGEANPAEYRASPELLALALDAAAGLELERVPGSRSPRVRFGLVATGDSFIGAPAKKAQLRADFGAHACEMEGAAVAQVCHELGVPFLVVRGLSDRASGDAPEEARRNLGVAARNAAAIALAVVRRLAPPVRAAARP
jgi:adenosylhomocysteine nucleosidase